MPKTANKESELGGEKVEISSLALLQSFRYQGRVFTKRKVHPDGIRALSRKGDKLITLPPDTLVTPIEETSPKLEEEVSPEPGEAEAGLEPGEAEVSPEP